MAPRLSGGSLALLLLCAAWIGPRRPHRPPPFAEAAREREGDDVRHDRRPRLAAREFGQGLRARRRPGRRPNKPSNPRPNKRPNKRPGGGNSGGRGDGKDNDKSRGKANKNNGNKGDKGKGGGKDKDGGKRPGGGGGGGGVGKAAGRSLELLASKSRVIDSELFLYQTPNMQWLPSTIYNHDGLSKGLAIMNGQGVAGMTFYLGDDSKDKDRALDYGLTNVAAFLAQSMKETIKYNACSENNWDLYNEGYPASNACGQLGQSYQDYQCPKGEEHMACEVDPKMEIKATTNAKWYGAPAPFFCRPKKNKDDFTGKWNHGKFCNVPWIDPPMYCTDYKGQKAGGYDNDKPVANRAGRTDVEGCCWWGRGVIQTTGPCNFGKLNYYLGARAAKEGRKPPYPSVDFCKDPEVICSSSKYKELKWMAGMFYWMESVQGYDVGGWNYMDQLRKFVDGGLKDRGFIDAVSGIVNRGCHNPPCGTGAVDGGSERNNNFLKVLRAFDLMESPSTGSKPKPTGSKPKPTPPGGSGGSGGSGKPDGTGKSPPTACGADHKSASEKCKNVGCHTQLDCDGGEYCWNGVDC